MTQWEWSTLSETEAWLVIIDREKTWMVARICRVGEKWRAMVELGDDIVSQVDGFNSPEDAARAALEETVRVADDLLDAAVAAVGAKLPPSFEEVKP